MTEAMHYILLALLKPGHGYGMLLRIKEFSRRRVEMGPGTLYGVLSRMSRDGLIVLTGEDGRRKNYAITDAGLRAYAERWRSDGREKIPLVIPEGFFHGFIAVRPAICRLLSP